MAGASDGGGEGHASGLAVRESAACPRFLDDEAVVWTLQEFLLPPGVLVFHCGDKSIIKDVWYRAIGAIYEYSAQSYLKNQWARRRLSEYYTQPRRRDKMGLMAMMSDAVIKALVRCLCLDRSKRYLEYAARTSEYVHELKHVLASAPVPSAKLDVFGWFQANDALLIRGASLREHYGAATPPPKRKGASGQDTLWRAAESTIGKLSWDCRLIATAEGQMGMAPKKAMKGD